MKFHRKIQWFCGTMIAVGAALFLFLLFLNFYPIRAQFENSVSENTKIFDRNGVLIYETLHLQQGKTTFIPLSEIPKSLIAATVAVEDENFYEHSGIDFEGIFRAIFLNIKEGEVISGGSTITQQLARNVLGVNRRRTFFQKVKESLFALRAEKVFSKNEILELYFNKIYYGNLNYGAASASMGYFGKDIRNLDLAESSFLAGLPQAPNRYDPFKNREKALQRKNHVLSLLKKRGVISEEEFRQAKNETLNFEQNLVSVRAPHFVNYVIEELEDRFGENFVSAGLTVKTSLDIHFQDASQNIVRRNLALLAGRNVTNGSVVVLDPLRAEILAMVGSADYFDDRIDGKVNVAIRRRQPGSALKPITYAAAFEKGWDDATLIKDEPVRFFTADGTPYYPKNYDFEYHGEVTVREALANSYNIPAVKAIDFAGVEAVLQKMRAMGLETLDQSADHYGLALTLGDGEVRLIDLATAYMAFANGGVKKNPTAILEILDRDGNVIFEPTSQTQSASAKALPEPRTAGLRTSEKSGFASFERSKLYKKEARVFSAEISSTITDILSDKNARIPEFQR